MSLNISELGLGKLAEFSESAHCKNKPMKSSDSSSSVVKLQADFKTHVIFSDFSFDS